MALLSRLSFAPTEEGDSGVGEWGGKGREGKGREGGGGTKDIRTVELSSFIVRLRPTHQDLIFRSFFFLFFFYFYFCRRRDNSIERKQKRKKKGEEKKENARRDGN